MSGETTSLTVPAVADDFELSKADIRRNMLCVIFLDAIFMTGWTDYQLALQPFLVWLGASNVIIGMVSGAQWMALPGMLLSPLITRRFRYKKWYMIGTHVPYLLPLGLAGLLVVLGNRIGLVGKHEMLTAVFICVMASVFFGGFVSLPHQEYVAAVIPMAYRGRFTGYSQSVGGVAGILAAALGGYILLRLPKPLSFGWVMFFSYAIIQSGYFLAVLARERPTPVERSPKPWSKDMFTALLKDRVFMKLIGLQFMAYFAINAAYPFVNTYGFRDLHMIPATSATIQIITQAARVGLSFGMGIVTDRLTARRVLPYWIGVGGLALLPAVLLKNPMGVYLVAGLSQVFVIGAAGAFNALVYGIPKPENRAGHFTIQIIVSQMGMALGPLTIGWFCDQLPYITVFTGVVALSVAIFFIARRICSEMPADLRSYS